jgi:hypothetical protein
MHIVQLILKRIDDRLIVLPRMTHLIQGLLQ